MQRVAVDGVRVFSHDLAAALGSGWTDVLLGPVGPKTRKVVLSQIEAVRPDPGAVWGKMANTTFRLVRTEEEP